MNERYRHTRDYFQRQGFIPADRNSYSIFRAYESSSILEERSAAIIATWSFAYNGLYKIIRGNLCGIFF